MARGATEFQPGLDHAACAPFVAGKLHKFFHGTDPSPPRRTELATIFRNANLEIRPLVEAILRDPMFFDPSVRMTRAKLPVEWVTNACATLAQWMGVNPGDVLADNPAPLAGITL